MTQDAAAYTDVVVSPDGHSAYAPRSSCEIPPEAVSIELQTGEVGRLRNGLRITGGLSE